MKRDEHNGAVRKNDEKCLKKKKVNITKKAMRKKCKCSQQIILSM